MKRTLALAAILAGLLTVALPAPAAKADVSVSFSFFHDNLAPYGRWVTVGSYGRLLVSGGCLRRMATVHRRPLGLGRLRLDLGLRRSVGRLDVSLRNVDVPAAVRLGLGAGLRLGARLGDVVVHERLHRMGPDSADVLVRGHRLLRLACRGEPELRTASCREAASRPRTSSNVRVPVHENQVLLARSQKVTRFPVSGGVVRNEGLDIRRVERTSSSRVQRVSAQQMRAAPARIETARMTGRRIAVAEPASTKSEPSARPERSRVEKSGAAATSEVGREKATRPSNASPKREPAPDARREREISRPSEPATRRAEAVGEGQARRIRACGVPRDLRSPNPRRARARRPRTARSPGPSALRLRDRRLPPPIARRQSSPEARKTSGARRGHRRTRSRRSSRTTSGFEGRPRRERRAGRGSLLANSSCGPLRSVQFETERLHQERRHLPARRRIGRAVVRPSASRGDSSRRDLFDEVGKEARAFDVVEDTRARRRDIGGSLERPEKEHGHLLTQNRIVGTVVGPARRGASRHDAAAERAPRSRERTDPTRARR